MKKLLMIIFGSLIFILLVLVIWQVIYFFNASKGQVYVLPEGFKGIVLIAYDQQDGLEDVKENGKLIYRIPKNGILRLKRKEAATISQSWYYFEDDQGNRTEFYYCFPPCEEMKNESNEIFAFGKTNGSFENEGEKLELTTFFVGASSDSDSLNKVYDKYNPIEVIKKLRKQ